MPGPEPGIFMSGVWLKLPDCTRRAAEIARKSRASLTKNTSSYSHLVG